MAEDDLDRADGGFEALGGGEELGRGVAEGVGVVAHDLEDPEDRRRAVEVPGDFLVAAAHQVGEAVAVGGVADGFGGKRAGVDEVEDQRPGLPVADSRGEAGGVGGAAGGELEGAHDVVLGDVAADAHEVAAAGVLDGEVEVGDAAGERLGVDRAGPDRQRRGEAAGGVGHRSRPRRARVRAAARVIRRSAIMAIIATQRPAVRPWPTLARVSAM